MNSYRIYFRNDVKWGMREFAAASPEAALELARQLVGERPNEIDLDQHYEDSNRPISEIEVTNGEDEPLAVWYDDDLRLRLAARDLLAATRQAFHALNTAPRFRVGETDSYAIAALCGAVIATATHDRAWVD